MKTVVICLLAASLAFADSEESSQCANKLRRCDTALNACLDVNKAQDEQAQAMAQQVKRLQEALVDARKTPVLSDGAKLFLGFAVGMTTVLLLRH